MSLEERIAALEQRVEELQRVNDQLRVSFYSYHTRIQKIQAYVAMKHHLDVRCMRSKARPESIAWPRMLAMWICREILDASLEEIAHAFNKRDHKTIMHACCRVQEVASISSAMRLKSQTLRMECEELLKE